MSKFIKVINIHRRLLILTKTELLTYNVDTGECTMHLALKKIKNIIIIDHFLVSQLIFILLNRKFKKRISINLKLKTKKNFTYGIILLIIYYH